MTTDTEAVSRADFDLLCEVVDTILGIAGGVADQRHMLSYRGREALTAYAAMRMGRPAK